MSHMGDLVTLMRGDRLPRLRQTLLIGKVAVDLTGATVVFNLRNEATGLIKVSAGACTVIGAATDGVVEYAWAATDTDTVGSFSFQFVATYSGLPMTVPNLGAGRLIISERVGA
jgi:hypothetical protein